LFACHFLLVAFCGAFANATNNNFLSAEQVNEIDLIEDLSLPSVGASIKGAATKAFNGAKSAYNKVNSNPVGKVAIGVAKAVI